MLYAGWLRLLSVVIRLATEIIPQMIRQIPTLSEIFRAVILRKMCASFCRGSHLNPGQVHISCMMNEVVLGQVLLQVLPFSPVSFIPPVLHTLKFVCHLPYILL